MLNKTHKTAIVLIPPHELWKPIQAIRRKHDPHVDRWMPHVTLVYPFRPRDEFDALEPVLAAALGEMSPFGLTLETFRVFDHGRGGCTIYLAPEPAAPVVRVEEALWQALPGCDDTQRYSDGLTPHLSVGHVHGEEAMSDLLESLQDKWQPLSFVNDHVTLIWRNDSPDDVFRADRSIRLGGAGPRSSAPMCTWP